MAKPFFRKSPLILGHNIHTGKRTVVQIEAYIFESVTARIEGFKRIIEERAVIGFEKDASARRKNCFITFQKKAGWSIVFSHCAFSARDR